MKDSTKKLLAKEIRYALIAICWIVLILVLNSIAGEGWDKISNFHVVRFSWLLYLIIVYPMRGIIIAFRWTNEVLKKH